MKDRYWRAAHRALQPLVKPDDVVLAPRGGWDPFPCALRAYDTTIEPGDETVLVLHKGHLPAIRKEHLAALTGRWGLIYANEVFVVFARSRPSALEARCGLWWAHLRAVRGYMRSRELKRRASTVYHVHLPKTGGTSLWARLSGAYPSSIYYSDLRVFLANPPRPGEYDVVGAHFSPAPLAGVVEREDLVVGLLREPTRRFLSAVTHCRRLTEDTVTFNPAQLAMREMRLTDFVKTEFGRYEARAQLIEMGRCTALGGEHDDDGKLLARALAFLDRNGTLIAPSEASDELVGRLERRLDRRLPRMAQLNVNGAADYARCAGAEVEEARPAIEALNAGERRLYAEAKARFERGLRAAAFSGAPCRAGPPRRRARRRGMPGRRSCRRPARRPPARGLSKGRGRRGLWRMS